MNMITDSLSLSVFCETLQEKDAGGYICVDTEFVREKTYWPELCLIQVAGSQDQALIDPLAPNMDLTPFYRLLENPKIVKVFHAARQDIEIFYHEQGVIPSPLFDTQVAAMVCGFGDSIGYGNLVQAVTGAVLDKGSRFTNWAHRPLTEAQKEYAMGDVTYLRQVYAYLQMKLAENGRLSWIDQEMEILKAAETYNTAPEEAWKKVKVRNVRPRVLARIQALAALREETAQDRDVPRGRLFKDMTLLEIAAQNPKTLQDFQKMRDGVGALGAEIRSKILACLERANSLSADQLPAVQKVLPNKQNMGAVVDVLKIYLKSVSQELGVSEKLIASSKDLEELAQAGGEPKGLEVLKGWRQQVFGKGALDLISGKKGLKILKKSVVIFDF